MTPIIVTFQSPGKLEDYIDSYNNGGNYHIDNLLDMEDFHEWPVDKGCSVGDFVFFRTGVDSAKKMNAIIHEAEQLYPGNPDFIEFLRQNQMTYKKYAGMLFEVGIIEEEPFEAENGKWFASIGELHVLDNPVPYSELKKIRRVVSGGTISKLSKEQLGQVASLILEMNPEMDFDGLRFITFEDLLRDMTAAHDEERQAAQMNQVDQENHAGPQMHPSQEDRVENADLVDEESQGTDLVNGPAADVLDVHNARHEVVIHRTAAQYARDQKLVQKLKNLYACRCQLCASDEYWDIPMENGQKYIEVHHIIPNSIGYDDEGKSVDNPGNMIVVCPNHHRYLHYHKGGEYRLGIENGALVLKNSSDKVEVLRDLHLWRLMK